LNSIINYLYRDRSDCKIYPESDVIVRGELSREDFGESLHGEKLFIPHDIGLPELQAQLAGYPNVDVHIWHQLDEIKPTEETPTVEITAGEIKSRLDKIKEEGWNDSAACKRQEFIKSIWR